MNDKSDLNSPSGKSDFLESITPENCGEKLTLVRESMLMTKRDLASVLGCSESTISRLEAKKTKPTKDFMNRLMALVFIGDAKFKSLNKHQKDNLIQYMSITSGAGIAAALATLSSSGTITGLSAAGVASGLGAIGVTLLGGATLVAPIPLAAGLATFGIAKGIKAICESNELSCKEIDGRFEIKLIRKE